MSSPEAIELAKRFEPILLFHPDERFFPVDPKFYLERCALWRSEPPSDNVQDWGELPHTTFPRRPQIDKGKIAALKDEVTAGKTWIGEPSNLVIPESPAERPLAEDRFLQLTGWEPLIDPPNEVTATSENRHPTLAHAGINPYNEALQGGRPWYYLEYLDHQQLLAQFGKKNPGFIDLSKLIGSSRLGQPRLLVYHFLYALHEEPLRGCEKAGEGETFATFAGEWTSVAIIINSAREPLYIGLTSRNLGDPTSIPAQENRLGMIVHPWQDASRVGDHPKIFVSRGTHGNYLSAGPHALTPFTPGDIDLNHGTCGEIEKLDDVIPGGDAYTIPGEKADTGMIVYKALLCYFCLAVWFFTEHLHGTFGGESPALEPDRTPQDETGGPLFGLILRPAALAVPEQSSAQRTEDWKTREPAPGDKPRHDFIVDRKTQLWWPPRGASPGYAGRWGPRVSHDPKARRSGMRCPPFALLFLTGLARL